jgi:hypothetical protein
MATSSELKEIQDLIWGYRDTADRDQKKKLRRLLEYETSFLKQVRRKRK